MVLKKTNGTHSNRVPFVSIVFPEPPGSRGYDCPGMGMVPLLARHCYGERVLSCYQVVGVGRIISDRQQHAFDFSVKPVAL